MKIIYAVALAAIIATGLNLKTANADDGFEWVEIGWYNGIGGWPDFPQGVDLEVANISPSGIDGTLDGTGYVAAKVAPNTYSAGTFTLLFYDGGCDVIVGSNTYPTTKQ